MQNMQNLRKTQNYQLQQQQQGTQLQPQSQQNQNRTGAAETPGPLNSQNMQEPDTQTSSQVEEQPTQQDQQNQSLPQLQQISQSLASDLGLYNDSLLLNSLLDDPYLGLQLTGRQNQNISQQFSIDSQVDGLTFNHNMGGGVCKGQDSSYSSHQGVLDLLDSTEHQFLNPNQNQNFGSGRHTIPNIILTGDSPPGLSKEITSALSGVPGFEVDPFSSDDPLRMDPLALDGLGMLTDGDLMLADPAVEDSFRSDRLK